LGNGGQNMDRQLVGVRIVAGNERHARIHDGRYKGDFARQPIQLGDHKRGALAPTRFKRLFQLGPICALAALDLVYSATTSQEPPFR
jgi:hypothetical protein